MSEFHRNQSKRLLACPTTTNVAVNCSDAQRPDKAPTTGQSIGKHQLERPICRTPIGRPLQKVSEQVKRISRSARRSCTAFRQADGANRPHKAADPHAGPALAVVGGAVRWQKPWLRKLASQGHHVASSVLVPGMLLFMHLT